MPSLRPRKKVAAYARVSMESERMHHSLSAQVSYYSSLIQKNPEWEYAGVYADYGISGTGIKKRQEFQRMLEDAEAGKIDLILTKSIQRCINRCKFTVCTDFFYHLLGILLPPHRTSRPLRDSAKSSAGWLSRQSWLFSFL